MIQLFAVQGYMSAYYMPHVSPIWHSYMGLTLCEWLLYCCCVVTVIPL